MPVTTPASLCSSRILVVCFEFVRAAARLASRADVNRLLCRSSERALRYSTPGVDPKMTLSSACEKASEPDTTRGPNSQSRKPLSFTASARRQIYLLNTGYLEEQDMQWKNPGCARERCQKSQTPFTAACDAPKLTLKTHQKNTVHDRNPA